MYILDYKICRAPNTIFFTNFFTIIKMNTQNRKDSKCKNLHEFYLSLINREEEITSSVPVNSLETSNDGAVARSRSSDILRSSTKKESPEPKKSHFNSLKQWGKNRLKMMKSEAKTSEANKTEDIDDVNIYETVTMKRKRSVEREKKMQHERKPSCSSSDKSSINVPVSTSAVMNIAVKLRDSSAQRRLRRNGGNKDEPHSSSGNWSASSESGRASIGSEITSTTHPKSTISTTTSSNSLNLHPPSSVNSRSRYNANTSTSGSVTSEGTLTPDIIHDLHEDGETSSVYSCDTEGYYTSFHVDSGLKTLKEEDSPATPIHSTTAFSNNSSSNTVLTAENEYELFGKGSTSTTTSSAGTVCTTLRASESRKSLTIGPAVPERKSSLSKPSNKSPLSSLERDCNSDKTGTVKRSPASHKATVVAVIHKHGDGDISPDSGHNTSSSPIESINSPNGMRSGSEFEFSESSDIEGPDRIERIRIKTAINSSRIPSMCVITPPHSDDESVKSQSFENILHKNTLNTNEGNTLSIRNNNLNVPNFSTKVRTKLDLPLNQQKTEPDIIKSVDGEKDTTNPRVVITPVNGSTKMQLINVNPQSGYATIETIETKVKQENNNVNETELNTVRNNKRAPSPSGGTVIIKELPAKSPQTQPIFKASLLPLNNMFGKLKTNLSNFALRRDRSKSPNKNNEALETLEDSGEYVTIADVKNNNDKSNDTVNRNLKTILSGKVKETEYVSLDELPCNDPEGTQQNITDSLERKKRQGARVTLNAEGKVIYSSDSLKRKKGAHSTFEPGPFVKKSTTPNQSPLLQHRTPKAIRPVAGQDTTDSSRSLSPQLGKFVIRASSGMSPTSELVRMPPSTIVTPTIRPMSPKPTNSRGAYVHMQEPRGSLPPTREEGKTYTPFRTPQPQTNAKIQIQINNENINPNARKIKRSESYRLANSPVYTTRKIIINTEKLDIEDLIEKEIAAELWRERINYPPTVSPVVSPKLCEKQCHIYSKAHAQEMLLASPNKIPIPSDSSEHRARVLSVSVADTEIW